MELLKDSAGNYHVVVPKGGGVYLSVVLEKEVKKPAPSNEDKTKITNNRLKNITPSSRTKEAQAATPAEQHKKCTTDTDKKIAENIDLNYVSFENCR